MDGAGSDFVAKVQSVIWSSLSSILELQGQRDRINDHRVELQATLDAIGTSSIPQHMIESIDRSKWKLSANERSIEIYDIAINIAAGSLLQLARQAISMQHKGRVKCPEGRDVADLNVRDLIWYGRNQSMHYEQTLEGDTRSFFEKLEKDFPVEFPRRAPAASHAKAILDLLGWTTCPSLIEQDMQDLMQQRAAGLKSS